MPNGFRNFRDSTLASCMIVVGLSSCGHARGDIGRPESTQSSNLEAQAAFRVLRSAWFSGTESERQRLEPDLRRFVSRFPSDPESDLVRVLLAFNAVSRGALPAARVLLGQVSERVGAVYDFARVAEAYADLRAGHADAAWQVLDPLSGKIVDPDERRVFGELCLRAAGSAGRYQRALMAAEELLTEAPADAQSTLEQLVREQFSLLPKAVLVSSLAGLDSATANPGAEAAPREWLRKMLRERLVSIAVRDKDSELARQLLETAPAALRTSEAGATLVSIAGSAQSVPLVSGRSIGVALSLGTPELRRRSANLSAGLARGLGSAERGASAHPVHLLSQDDRATSLGTTDALRELAAEGAALLVAGVDGASADAAARFAEDNAIAVLLVHPPEHASGPFHDVFVLGESEHAEDAALEGELARRNLSRSARVGRLGEPCDTPAPGPGRARFSVQDWRRDRVPALLLLGPAACASDLAGELREAALNPLLALGLDAAEFVYSAEAPSRCIALGAGRFPMPAVPDGTRNPALPSPDWYESLGHDAGVLAARALADFPDVRVDEPRAVRQLHTRVERALGDVRAELWTTDREGFADEHVLRRTLTVISSPSTSKNPP